MISYENNKREHWSRRFDILSALGKLGLKSLSTKLFVGLLALTGFSIVLACTVAYFSFRGAIESSEQLRRMATTTSEAVDLMVYENIQSARAIANDDLVIEAAERAARDAEKLGITRTPDPKTIEALENQYKDTRVLKRDDSVDFFLQEKRQLKGVFERMFFTDRYGLNVAMTSMSQDFVQSDEVWWKEAMRTGMYIEDIGFDTQTNTFDLELCVAIPSRRGGWNGVLKVKYNLQDAQEYISRFKQYDSGYAYAVSSKGVVLIHPDSSLRNVDMSEAMRKLGVETSVIRESGMLAMPASQQGGLLEYDGVNPQTKKHETRLASYDKEKGLSTSSLQFPGFGWTFVVDNSKDEVYAPAYKMLRVIAIAGTVAFGIAALIALLFVRGFSRKIEDLVHATDEVSAGNLDARVSITTNDELEKVGQGFNQMMDRLAEKVRSEEEQKEALRNSEYQYRNLFDSANDAILIFAPETERILEANARACELYGFGKNELVGMSLKRLSKDVQYGEQQIQTILSQQTLRNFETVHFNKEGEALYLLVSCSVIDYDNERAILSIHRDITDRRRTEEALKQSEEKYRTILESIEDGYYEVDLSGKLVFFNEPVTKILGYPEKELIGLGHRDYVDKETAESVMTAFNRVFKTGEAIQDFSYQIRRKDGAVRHVESSISLKRDGAGQPVGFLGIIRDVTERREAERELERSMGEFLSIASAVSDGDLTRRGAEGEDTLGRVVGSVNRMLDNFSGMLTKVKQIGLSVSSSATEILAAAEQIAVGSQRQADEITNTSSAVEEMAASMSQVSRNAEASADTARRGMEMAQHGDASVRDTSEAMIRIDAAVQQTAEKMRLLGTRSSEISEIIDLINEIAAQTNLLALNAAIEAAHAGDAGLGFSVVADEIRKLAERSSRATRDVGSLIKSIQNETAEALAAMENGMKEVKTGSLLAGQASRALQDISDAVRQSAELIEEISAASEEQARVTRNLAGAMQTISSITLETSAGAHETAQTIQGMVGLSEQLNSAILQFKVKDDFVHPFSYDIPGSPVPPPGNGSRLSGFSQRD
ncbi:MAG TPA: PAS domain S-box protein [Blastocatellia bacterium]|nr:PAS domain S-box protein [Blastocatellia bacterium]